MAKTASANHNQKVHLGAYGAVTPLERHYPIGSKTQKLNAAPHYTGLRAEGGLRVEFPSTQQAGTFSLFLGGGGQVFYPQNGQWPRLFLYDSHLGGKIEACLENCNSNEEEVKTAVVAQHQDFQRATETTYGRVFANLGFTWTPPVPEDFSQWARLSFSAYLKAGVSLGKASQKTAIGYWLNQTGQAASEEIPFSELPRGSKEDWYMTLEGNGYPVANFFWGAGGATDFALYQGRKGLNLSLGIFVEGIVFPQHLGVASDYIQDSRENNGKALDNFEDYDGSSQGIPKVPPQSFFSWGPRILLKF